jgi:hypothetical protein
MKKTLLTVAVLSGLVGFAGIASAEDIAAKADKADVAARAVERTNKPFDVKFGTNSNVSTKKSREEANELLAAAEASKKNAIAQGEKKDNTARARMKSE